MTHRQFTALDMPTMAAINARPKHWVGASMFAGCGGASTGLKMAGVDVRYANEFIPGAARTYARNAPQTHVDTRDIRQIDGREILKICRVRRGEMDWFDGSPPCFPAGELVFTNRGPVPIERVAVGDLVLTHAKNWRHVTDVMSRQYYGKLVVLQAGSLPRTRSTPEHPYYTCSAGLDQDPDWTEARDVTVRHVIFVPDGENALLHNLSSLVIQPGMDLNRLASRWALVNRLETEIFDGTVYNISVDVDESYVVNGMAVHNCKAYSSASRHNRVGKRADEKVLYSEGVYQRVDDLFENHIRVVKTIMPRIASIENVPGLAQSSSLGAFTDICDAIKSIGYELEVREIAPALLGVPQTRNRLVFIAIRRDLYRAGLRHRWPRPYTSPVITVRDCIPAARWISRGKGDWKDARNPSPTLTVVAGRGDEFSGLSAGPFYKDEQGDVYQYDITELKMLFGFPRDFVLGGNYLMRYERLARTHAPLAVYNIASAQLSALAEM